MRELMAWPLGNEYHRASAMAEARSGRARAKISLSPRLRSAPAPTVTSTKMAEARSWRASRSAATTDTSVVRPAVPPMLVAARRRVVTAGWRMCPNHAWTAWSTRYTIDVVTRASSASSTNR
jgi:hypothetical protein